MDLAHFTPGSALAGGALIGLAAVWLMLANGRIEEAMRAYDTEIARNPTSISTRVARANALRGLLIEKGIKIKEAATALSGNSVIVASVSSSTLATM